MEPPNPREFDSYYGTADSQECEDTWTEAPAASGRLKKYSFINRRGKGKNK